MLFLVFIIILFILGIGLLLQSAVLYIVTTLFKIKITTFRKSFVISLFQLLFTLAAMIVIAIILMFAPLSEENSQIILGLLILISACFAFYIFHYFLKRYYETRWFKSLLIFLAFYLGSSLINTYVMPFFIMSVRTYVVSPFYIAGISMNPTLNEYDYILVNKFQKQFSRGDIIVFNDKREKIPQIKNSFVITRIIGLPNENIEIRDGQVFVNRTLLEEPYIQMKTAGYVSVTLENNEYFVLGDNRNNSLDSRFHGPISLEDIEGKMFFTLHSSQWKTKTF